MRNKQVRGDHYVTLVVQIPTKLNNEQKELLRKFDSALNGTDEKSTPVKEEKLRKKDLKKI